MKKASILLILTCALSLNACAQWYLFPGKKKQTEPTKTVTDSVRKTQADSARVQPGAEAPHVDPSEPTQPGVGTLQEPYELDMPGVIRIGLALPLQASSQKPSDNFLDFYSGALMALRDLGNSGVKVDLQVYDTADSKTAVPQSLIDDSDVIIGPVSYDELAQSAAQCGGKVLVSPLEPKAAALAATGSVVQAPSAWNAQQDEVVRWIREDLPVGDVLYVVRDTAALVQGEQSAYFIAQLQDRSVRYQSVLSVHDIPFRKGQKVRVAIASDRENFITNAVRALSVEAARNNGVVLYGTSRVRTNGINQTDLHNTEAHLTVSYFIDYDDPEVKRFIRAYRSLFKNEPGSFSFQGYDTMHYFVTMCAKFGRQWPKKLTSYGEKGLQADFRFDHGTERVNVAARRVIYHPDLTTSVQRY